VAIFISAILELAVVNTSQMEQNNNTTNMKQLYYLLATAIFACLSLSCSDNDDNIEAEVSSNLYAVIKPEGAQLIDIIPEDYVLTLDNIVAVNPETGEFKIKDSKRIDEKAFPIPTQYVIMFYSGNSFLFEAKLNSAISSALSTGLNFCHLFTDASGMARYDLEPISLINGKVSKGNSTDQQKKGIQRMYDILRKARKIDYHIDYDINY
jgi:hypothetical protein